MRGLRDHLGISLSALVVAFVVHFVLPSPSAHAQLGIGTSVTVTEEHQDGPRLARAFVRTDSDNPLALCTINENSPGFGPLRLAGLLALCRYRQVEGLDGIGITIIFPPLFDTSAGFGIQLTLFQEGAQFYESPIPCPGEC